MAFTQESGPDNVVTIKVVGVGGAVGASCSGMILEAGRDFHYPALMGAAFALAGCLVSLGFGKKTG